MSDREQTDRRKSAKNYHVFIPLQKMLSLLVSAHFSIVSPSVRTEKVPRFDLEITIYSSYFVLCNSWNLCCTHWRIWAPTRKPEVIRPWISPEYCMFNTNFAKNILADLDFLLPNFRIYSESNKTVVLIMQIFNLL